MARGKNGVPRTAAWGQRTSCQVQVTILHCGCVHTFLVAAAAAAAAAAAGRGKLLDLSARILIGLHSWETLRPHPSQHKHYMVPPGLTRSQLQAEVKRVWEELTCVLMLVDSQ